MLPESWFLLVFLVTFHGFKILIILIKVLCVIRPVTRLYLQLLFWGQFLLLIKLLILRMRVPRLVVHWIVHIHTLMIKQLSKRHHCCILEVLAETSCYQVGLDPFYVLQTVCWFLVILRILCAYLNKISALLFEIFLLLRDPQLHPAIFHTLQFLLVPEYRIVYVFGKVPYQVVPFGLETFLVLVQQKSQQNVILPILGKLFVEKLWVLFEHPTLLYSYFWMSLKNAIFVVNKLYLDSRSIIVLARIFYFATRPG